MIRLGLCCLNTELRKKRIFCSRTVTRARFTVERAQELALQNIHDAGTMMKWNYQHQIYVFRLSSDMFPHFTDLETESYSMDFAIDALVKLGKKARKYQQRITMHPGQYNQIGTPHYEVLAQTVRDLSHHADILDYMGMDQTSILCIHGGGVYSNKEETMYRWIAQFHDLPVKVKRRLAIENCERMYSAKDVLFLSEECKIPVIFDTHHHDCYQLIHGKDSFDAELLEDIIETWDSRIPIMHISEQKENARIGAHSDYIETIPDFLFQLDTNIDIEVEAKQKELAIFKLYDKYPQLKK